MNMSQDDLDLRGLPDTKDSVLAHLLLNPMRSIKVPPPLPPFVAFLKVAIGFVMAAAFCLVSIRYLLNPWVNFALPGFGLLFYLAVITPAPDPPGAGNERLTIRQNSEPVPKPEPDLSSRMTGDWDSIVNAIAASKNPIERDHLFRGWLHGTHHPLLISPKMSSSHIAFFGTTGIGMTSAGMVPLIVQTIRRRQSVVNWYDMKGDEFTYETLRLEAEQAGLPCMFPQPLPGRP